MEQTKKPKTCQYHHVGHKSLQSLFPKTQALNECSMHNVGNLIQGIITHLSLNPKLKIGA
jgi:hypothetical protein